MSTFNTGLTGLKAYQTDIDVVGNNIANVNTTGFKASRTQFADLLVQSIEGATAPSGTTGGTDPVQLGQGVIVSSVLDLQTQGQLETTGRPSDLAIQGDGFFVLSDGVKQVFTRAGTFELDANGNLVDSATGLKVQGTNGDITIPIGSSLSPTPTTEVELTGNLDANAADGTTLDTSFFVIDSLGGQDLVKITFTANGSGAFDYSITGATSGSITPSPASGTITFASGGAIDPSSIKGPLASGGSITLHPGTVAADVAFTIDLTNLTGFTAPSSVSMSKQDGVTQGSLLSFSVGRNGTVTGVYSNGKSKALGMLEVASFANPAGLQRISNTQFVETPNSGVAVIGSAGTGGRGTIAAGALEQSNVDLANEFVNLIIAQRGYEANARVVTVADQIQQTTVNLVR